MPNSHMCCRMTQDLRPNAPVWPPTFVEKPDKGGSPPSAAPHPRGYLGKREGALFLLFANILGGEVSIAKAI